MNVSEICTRQVVATDRNTTLQRAASLMRERHVGTVVVTAPGAGGTQAIGIVTDRDLAIEGMAHGLDAERTTLAVLTAGKRPAAIASSASVEQAIAALNEHGVRRLLVCNEDGGVCGIVSLEDMLVALAHQVSQHAVAVRAGIERETRERASFAPLEEPVRVPAYSSAAYGQP
jgi:CBS domain-containing protein